MLKNPTFRRHSTLKLISLTLLISIQSFNSLAQTSSKIQSSIIDKERKSQFETSWKMSLQGAEITSPDTLQVYSKNSLTLKFKYKLIENLTLFLEPALLTSSGNFQSASDADSSPSELKVNQAYLQIGNEKQNISTGILNQKNEIDSSFISKDNSFTTFKAQSHYEDLNLKLLYSIVDLKEKSSATGEIENPPQIIQTKFDYRYNTYSYQSLVSFGGFKFISLNKTMATKSSLYGNSTKEYSQTLNEYLYNYEGGFTKLDLNINFTKNWDIGTTYEGIINTQAPKGLSTGAIFGISNKYKINTNLQFQLITSAHHIEPDAYISSLTNSSYGGTNREGYEIASWFYFPKNLFKAGFGIMKTNVLNETALQTNEQMIWIRLETSDVKI